MGNPTIADTSILITPADKLLLKVLGFMSFSEGRRLIACGKATVGNETVTDIGQKILKQDHGKILSVGGRKIKLFVKK